MSQPVEPMKVCVAWYKRGQWQKLRDVSADAGKLALTWDEWFAGITAQVEELRRSGVRVSKVIVDVDELVSWCSAQRRRVDASSAAAYAARLAESGRSIDW